MSDEQLINSCRNAIISLDKDDENYKELIDLMLGSLTDSCGLDVALKLTKDLEEEGVL